MALISEEIIAEDENTLTIRFTNRSGTRYRDRTVRKFEGVTNEDLLRRWHRRMTLEYLQRPFRFKRIITEQQA